MISITLIYAFATQQLLSGGGGISLGGVEGNGAVPGLAQVPRMAGLGFEAHFSTAFKKRFGICPSQIG